MTCRGIRGAVCVETNDAAAIVAATREMLERIVADNDVVVDDIACVIFTATPDLDTAYPARAARELGWMTTPLLCEQEMVVKGGMPLCIRALVLWNTDLAADKIQHVYLGKARALRPDLCGLDPAAEDEEQGAGSNKQG
jgi:chorismate mutase